MTTNQSAISNILRTNLPQLSETDDDKDQAHVSHIPQDTLSVFYARIFSRKHPGSAGSSANAAALGSLLQLEMWKSPLCVVV